MTAKHISDARQRRSKKYLETHARLEREVREGHRPSLASRSPKQVRKWARSELYRLTAE